jgi:nucleotide-binding universal stress UspA family protein
MNGRLRRVALGTDFTPGARRAAKRALRLPYARGAEVELFHAAPRAAPATLEIEVRRLALRALEREAERMRDSPLRASAGLRVRATLGSGEPAIALLRAARASRADLVIVGAHGRSGLPDLDLGSTAEHLIQHGDMPVLVVHRDARGPYGHALVATDLAGSVRSALALAVRWMTASGGRMTLMHALEPPAEAGLQLAGTTPQEMGRWRTRTEQEVGGTLDAEARRLEEYGLAVEPIIARGDPRDVLVRAARRLRVDLVVLGSRPARDRTGLLLGSVARRLARHAPCDVLVVRPAARRAAG